MDVFTSSYGSHITPLYTHFSNICIYGTLAVCIRNKHNSLNFASPLILFACSCKRLSTLPPFAFA